MGGGEPIYIALCAAALRADRDRRMVKRYDELLRNGHSGQGAVSVIVREFAPISNRTVEKIVNSPLPDANGATNELAGLGRTLLAAPDERLLGARPRAPRDTRGHELISRPAFPMPVGH